MRCCCAFTVVELLVVIALIALLMAMFTTALANSRLAADRIACLHNMRQLEIAHWAYLTDNDGVMLAVADTANGESWTEALRDYNEQLLIRSPLDTSPHFAGGTPVNGEFRLTSYSINSNLSPDNPNGLGLIDEVKNPSNAVHFVIKVFKGRNAVLNNVNPNAWHAPGIQRAMANAAKEIQVNAHVGAEDSVSAMSAYGFLDGHAEQLSFEEVYGEDGDGGFNPRGKGKGKQNSPLALRY